MSQAGVEAIRQAIGLLEQAAAAIEASEPVQGPAVCDVHEALEVFVAQLAPWHSWRTYREQYPKISAALVKCLEAAGVEAGQ